MPAFRDFPIKIKLTLMILSSSLIALTITSFIFIARDRASFRDQLSRDMTIRAEILAANSASAVSFDDTDAAKQILGALQADQHVLAAAILKPDGSPFATYGTTGAAIIAANSILKGNTFGFVEEYLDVTHDIMDGGKKIGQLFIRTELSAMDARVTWYVGMTTVVACIVIALTWILAAVYQRYITRPVTQLARAADQIALGNINQKLEYQSRDEIGNLYDSFRSLVVYMRDLSRAAEQVANNDLTAVITPKSENDVLSHSFRIMVSNLSTMVKELRTSAATIVSAASEIAASSEHMSRGAGDQARQISEVFNAIEEISATIMESVNNAGEASQQSRTASQTASSGGELVSETIDGMQKLTQIVRESAVTISKLAKSSEQIGQIVGVINDIADQTNLLALNAAIEAARAGESGRGFAVVADEVRKLAERTGKATGEISQMVKSIQHETIEAVDSMKSGVHQADIGRELADKAQRSLAEIVTSTQQVLSMIEQIARVSKVQSDSAEEISKNIEHISTVTRETAAGAEQSSQAATELNQQASTLQQMVERFRVV